MRLSIRHRTLYRYDPPAVAAALRLRLFPPDCALQQVSGWSVTVNGDAPSAPLVNAYGDAEAIWIKREPTAEIEVVAEGVVETTDVAGVLGQRPEAARPAVFLRATALTEPLGPVEALADKLREAPEGLDRGHAAAAMVRDAVEYRTGATDAATTAAEALATGAGVCQDHAHVFCAVMRALGAPARYVSGYLHTGDGPSEAGPGSTETHAWAETWIDGLGWVGFDPSNGVCPTEDYVRLACGLDAEDAAPLRGAFTGATAEALEAAVTVAAAQQ